MIETKPTYYTFLARWPNRTRSFNLLIVSCCALKLRKTRATKGRFLKFLCEEVFAAAARTKTNEILIALTAVLWSLPRRFYGVF